MTSYFGISDVFLRGSVAVVIIALASLQMGGCSSSSNDDDPSPVKPGLPEGFYFGADLSYVNQVEDKGGVFRDGGVTVDPYTLFADKGTNLVRIRLWHNPAWTKTVYGDDGTQMYSDIDDVMKSIDRAKAAGAQVLLDFHYSDLWADPGSQQIPEAWKEIVSLDVLEDSVYNYTAKVLGYLKNEGLQPELAQIGNEINCGMMFSEAPANFPKLNACEGHWHSLGRVINAGIEAVNDANTGSSLETKVILHVADPKNVDWWFTNITGQGGVNDFDMIGFSWYPLWHTTVPLSGISASIATFKNKFDRDVIILETAYPWTTDGADSYNNSFFSEPAISGYPKSPEGQRDFLIALTEEVIDGGGVGIVYWEPAWISAGTKDLWGQGSSWENCAFFDFDGNSLPVFDYMSHEY